MDLQPRVFTSKEKKEMKKVLVVMMAALMVLGLAACGGGSGSGNGGKDVMAKGEGVMTYEEYAAADLDSEVVVETFVQDKQSWWEDKATVYTQDGDGGYFLYNMACSKEDYDKLVEGQKIKVKGFKAEWSGEVEIIDATFEILDGNFVAEAEDATKLLANADELVKSQNKKVAFKGMVIEPSKNGDQEAAYLYSWDGSGQQGDDLYFNASVDGQTYTFCVESYLRGSDTDVYKAVEGLNIGDTVDMEGFLYWYEGPQPHITGITVK